MKKSDKMKRRQLQENVEEKIIQLAAKDNIEYLKRVHNLGWATPVEYERELKQTKEYKELLQAVKEGLEYDTIQSLKANAFEVLDIYYSLIEEDKTLLTYIKEELENK